MSYAALTAPTSFASGEGITSAECFQPAQDMVAPEGHEYVPALSLRKHPREVNNGYHICEVLTSTITKRRSTYRSSKRCEEYPESADRGRGTLRGQMQCDERGTMGEGSKQRRLTL